MKEIGKIWLEYRQQDTWYFLTWCPVTRYLTSRILTRNYWLDFSCFMFCLLLWWFFHFFSVSILFICCVWECQSTTEAGRESWRYLYPGAGADREVERERERGTIWPRVVSCNLCHLTSLTRGQPCLTRWGIRIITFVRSTKEYFLVFVLEYPCSQSTASAVGTDWKLQNIYRSLDAHWLRVGGKHVWLVLNDLRAGYYQRETGAPVTPKQVPAIITSKA